MNDEKLKVLYDQVAKRCYITSDDSLIKDRLDSIINNAIFNVKSILAITDENFDFSVSSMENELFLNYCMYRWNNKSQREFETNYMGDIIAIRIKNEVEYIKYIRSLEENKEEENKDEG